MSYIPSNKEYDKCKQEIETASDLEIRNIALNLLKENFKLKLKLTKAGLAEKQIIYIINTLDKSVGYLAMKFNSKDIGILLAANVVNFLESFFIAYQQIETLRDYEFEETKTCDLMQEIFVSLKDLCTVLREKQAKIRDIMHKYQNDEPIGRKRAPQVPLSLKNISQNHKRDYLDSSGAESDASELTEAEASSESDVDQEQYYVRKGTSSIILETDAEESALSDSSRNDLENNYSQRKKKSPVNSVKKRGRKRANQTVIENKEIKRRRISTDSRNESVTRLPKRKPVFRGHRMGASQAEKFQENTSRANDEMSPSEIVAGKSGRTTSITILENDVEKKGRRRNSKTSPSDVHDEALSQSKPGSYARVPRGIRKKITGGLALPDDKMQLQKYNITKKLIVKLTDYFKGCSDKSDASNSVEDESPPEPPADENNVDATRSREANSSRESDEYEVLDEVEDDNNDKDNNSETENNEKDSPDEQWSVESVCGSKVSNAESNSDAIFSEEAKEDELDKTSEKSNNEDDEEMEAEVEEEEEEEEEEGEDDENCEKNSDSESEKSSESPKKKSTYGRRHENVGSPHRDD